MIEQTRVTAVRIYPGGRTEVRDTSSLNVLSVDDALEQNRRGFAVYVRTTDLAEFNYRRNTATTDSDPMLEDDMRRWLRAMVDAVVTDPDERAARYREIDATITNLNESNKPEGGGSRGV